MLVKRSSTVQTILAWWLKKPSIHSGLLLRITGITKLQNHPPKKQTNQGLQQLQQLQISAFSLDSAASATVPMKLATNRLSSAVRNASEILGTSSIQFLVQWRIFKEL